MGRLTRSAFLGTLMVSVARCSSFAGESASDTSDAGTASDDVADARSADAVVGDAGGGSFCRDSSNEFCDDFDQVGRQDLAAGWSSADGGGLLALDEMFARSPPRSLALNTPAITTTSPLRSALTLEVARSNPIPTVITVAFDMNVSLLAATQSGGYLLPLRLHFGETNTAVGFTLSGTASGFYESRPLNDAGALVASRFGNGPPLSPNTWQRVVFVLDRASRTMRLTFDGQGATRFLQADTTLTGPVRVELGAPLLTGDATQWKVSFDNVTLDVVR